MKPYFSLYNVQKGIFDIVGKLYGLTFSKISDISTYHPEAEVFEVTEGKKTYISLWRKLIVFVFCP